MVPRLAVPDKTYRSYPGAGHTLDFEPDRSRYLADMLEWLSTRSSARSSHTAYRTMIPRRRRSVTGAGAS